jgi:hypothetical protein
MNRSMSEALRQTNDSTVLDVDRFSQWMPRKTGHPHDVAGENDEEPGTCVHLNRRSP